MIDTGLRDLSILIGRPGAAADSARALTIDDDRHATAKNGEPSMIAGMNSESRPIRRADRFVVGSFSSCSGGGKSFVNRNLDAGNSCSVHPVKPQEMTAVIDNRNVHVDADF